MIKKFFTLLSIIVISGSCFEITTAFMDGNNSNFTNSCKKQKSVVRTLKKDSNMIAPLNYDQFIFNITSSSAHLYSLYLNEFDCRLFYASGALKPNSPILAYRYLISSCGKCGQQMQNSVLKNSFGGQSDDHFFKLFFEKGTAYPDLLTTNNYGTFDYKNCRTILKQGITSTKGVFIGLEDNNNKIGMKILSQVSLPGLSGTYNTLSEQGGNKMTYTLIFGLDDLQFGMATSYGYNAFGSLQWKHDAGAFVVDNSLEYYFDTSRAFGLVSLSYTQNGPDIADLPRASAKFDDTISNADSVYFSIHLDKIRSNIKGKTAYQNHYGIEIQLIVTHGTQNFIFGYAEK